MRLKTLDQLLNNSQATEAFKQAVRDLESRHATRLIECYRFIPQIKALRLIYFLLESYPDLKIEKIKVDGQSSCSGFVGKAKVWPGPLTIKFDWDCRWKAEEEGWVDAFGRPDQVRAAHKFGYRCFRLFEIEDAAVKNLRQSMQFPDEAV